MTVVSELLARFGIDFDTNGVKEGAEGVKRLGEAVKHVALAFVGGEIVRGLHELTNATSEWVQNLNDTSSAVGVSSNELLAWRTTVAGVGVEAEQLDLAFRQMSSAVDNARTGNADAQKTFRDLGVQLAGVNGVARPTNEIMRDTITALNGIEDPAHRVATATQLLGRAGARLLPAFSDAGAGLDRYRALVQSLFGGDIENAAAATEELDRANAEWDLTLSALKLSLGVELIPRLADLTQWLAEGLGKFREISKGTNVVKVGLYALAIAAGALGLSMAAPFLETAGIALLAAAAIGGIVLIVDDLISLFSGGRSVIGEWIDSLFGVGAAQTFVDRVRIAVADLTEWFTTSKNTAIETWDAISLGASEMGDEIASVWAAIKVGLDPVLQALDFLWEKLAGVRAAVSEVNEVALHPIDTLLGRTQTSSPGIAERIEQQRASINDVRRITQSTIALAQNTGGTVGAPTRGAQRTDVRQTNTTTIHVQGSGDPEEIARQVVEHVEGVNARNMREARAALVPTQPAGG